MSTKRLVELCGWMSIFVFATGLPAESAEITTASLLGEMLDLDRLTRFPDPPYTTRQFSSYDRKSIAPDKDGWFANEDRGHFLRTENNGDRTEYVMMDADGPGAIVRIWSANPSGTLRIYLDRNPAPVLEANMGDLLEGQIEGFPVPIAGRRAAGLNLYFPFPYARHCKVTSDNDGFYYHVNYRTYPEGTGVTTYQPGELQRHAAAIARLAREMASPRRAEAPAEQADTTAFESELKAGESFTIIEKEGPGVLTSLTVRIHSKDSVAAARHIVVRMTFDGEQTVECPLGDFFGSAPGLGPYASLPLGITDDAPVELWSHWRMPFRKDVRIEFRCLHDPGARIEGRYTRDAYTWSERSLLFHAGWRTQRDLPNRPFVDWPHLECKGKGRFVGGALYYINPVKMWWGEGDEKIYVDGEKFPSHFGTGTEDYYGYAWGSPELFSHAYHNQTQCDGPACYGNVSVNRFHILDDIPFTESFKFDVENWHWTEPVSVTRAAVSYWYARPGGSDFFKPITPEEARVVEVPPFGTPGVIEGEDMLILHRDGGSMPQRDDPRYSAETYLRWHPTKIGDTLKLAFQVKEPGEKRLIVRLASSHDFGIAQFHLNGKPIGQPIDAFLGGGGPMDKITLGRGHLKKGQNELTFKLVGKNNDATGIVFGLDYLRLNDVK